MAWFLLVLVYLLACFSDYRHTMRLLNDKGEAARWLMAETLGMLEDDRRRYARLALALRAIVWPYYAFYTHSSFRINTTNGGGR